MAIAFIITFSQVTLQQTHLDDKIHKVNMYGCGFVMVIETHNQILYVKVYKEMPTFNEVS